MTGRTLGVRLYHMDMLSFNISRDTMHQQQWLAVLEELGPTHLPIPNSFPQAQEMAEFSYNFIVSTIDREIGRRTGRHGRQERRQNEESVSQGD